MAEFDKINLHPPLRRRFLLFITVTTAMVYLGIYYEGIYMVKVILTEIRHFECPNEKVEENGLVTKSSILSKESLGWPNTQIQIHKYTNTVWAESEDRHDMCYIFEKLMLRGCQNQCLQGSDMKIHKYTNTQIHKYTNTQIQFWRKLKISMTCTIFLKS